MGQNTLKARALIGGAAYDPATLKVLYQVFDDAWERVSPQVSARPEALEAARMKLAEFVLELAPDQVGDPEQLTRAAVAKMLAAPPKLRS
jgi:hypothetical protein